MIEVKARACFDKEGEIYYLHAPVIDGKEYSMMAESEDIAMLIGIGIKYDGVNSQFAKMATRMLGIKSAWSE